MSSGLDIVDAHREMEQLAQVWLQMLHSFRFKMALAEPGSGPSCQFGRCKDSQPRSPEGLVTFIMICILIFEQKLASSAIKIRMSKADLSYLQLTDV
jgi:hypothetical protein